MPIYTFCIDPRYWTRLSTPPCIGETGARAPKSGESSQMGPEIWDPALPRCRVVHIDWSLHLCGYLICDTRYTYRACPGVPRPSVSVRCSTTSIPSEWGKCWDIKVWFEIRDHGLINRGWHRIFYFDNILSHSVNMFPWRSKGYLFH